MVKDVRIEEFDYDLPDNLIPKYPLQLRDTCKLLVMTPSDKIYHRIFNELPDLMPPGSLMVCNDTKVINARLIFHKTTGAEIEVFLLAPISPADYAMAFQSKSECLWKCLVGNLKKWKDEEISLKLSETGDVFTLHANQEGKTEDNGVIVRFSWDNPKINFSQILEKLGNIPIPPYLNRDSEKSDLADYQTIYACHEGSVAAPTAGLHFTPQVFESLNAHAVRVEKLTLHVGAGTFRPVKSVTIGEHDMHSERFSVSYEFIKALLEWKKSGRPVIAVGTTSVRSIESIPYISEAIRLHMDQPFHLDQWRPYSESNNDFDTVKSLEFLKEWMERNGKSEFSASTSIMIAPGFKWRITNGMVTNFHQPKSTLLLLVSSFLGKDGDYSSWRRLYDEALKESYRFLSYGDASLLLRN